MIPPHALLPPSLIARRALRRAACTVALLIAGLVGGGTGSDLLPVADAALWQPPPVGAGARRVNDPGALEKSAISLAITDDTRILQWPLVLNPASATPDGNVKLPPGRYHLSARLRIRLPTDPKTFDHSRLQVTLSEMDGETKIGARRLLYTQFDPRAGAYTEIGQTFDLDTATALKFTIDVSILPLRAGEKPRPAVILSPDEPGENDGTLGKEAATGVLAAMGNMLEAENAVELSSLRGPLLLIDDIELTAIDLPVVIEKVWPEKIHVYPGDPNPVAVTVHNFTAKATSNHLRLSIRTGLDEVLWTHDQTVSIPAASRQEVRFDWPGGTHEYGMEARAELVDGDVVKQTVSEYFSVSDVIWKTAIQGSGFILWYDREDKLEEHALASRTGYVNVEEAFSWQPSSWDDLLPEAASWWTGQNDFHNSLSGLKLWIGASHAQGIKMITYMWATASGPAGAETARRQPETITHERIGLSSEMHDVEDLRLYPYTHDPDRPALWRHQYGIWNGFNFNRGMFGTMVIGANQVIESSKRFGWDGVRFDSPPSWSAMGAAGVHWQFKHYGYEEMMRRLLPEYIDQTEGEWSSEAISVRNIRFMRERFREEFGPRFAVSDNCGTGAGPFYEACATNQGQIMHEAIRMCASWGVYRKTVLEHVQATRPLGGHTCFVTLESGTSFDTAMGLIYIYAGGGHPYLGGATPPISSLPGPYSQMATRYGEYLWDLDLAPIDADAAGLAVENDKGLIWKPFVRRRALPDGRQRTVIHLTTTPPTDAISPLMPPPMPPWRTDIHVTVAKATADGKAPVVWRMSVEPTLQGEPMTPTRVGDSWQVTVPLHQLWTMLVVEEGGK